MKNVLITGGSGLVGRLLTKLLEQKGHTVAWMSRKASNGNPEKGEIRRFKWDLRNGYVDPEAIEFCDGIIHLAGAGIADKRWTKSRKAEIIASRVDGLRLLRGALEEKGKNLDFLISASATGWYKKDTGKLLDEAEPCDSDFLGITCREWEKEIQEYNSLVRQLSIVRIGIVLANEGGALPELSKTMKFGFYGRLGSGKQNYSWIHLEDLARMFAFVLEEKLSGTYNAVASYEELGSMLKKIAKSKRRKALAMPVPSFGLRLMLGEMSNMLLRGMKVSNKKIKDKGFQFRFEELGSALEDLNKTEKS